MDTRRHFIQGALAGLGGSAILDGPAVLSGAAAGEPGSAGPATDGPASRAPARGKTGSDVGSLYPFIQGQAVHGEFPLSYLRAEFRDVAAWKVQARGKL